MVYQKVLLTSDISTPAIQVNIVRYPIFTLRNQIKRELLNISKTIQKLGKLFTGSSPGRCGSVTFAIKTLMTHGTSMRMKMYFHTKMLYIIEPSFKNQP